MPKIIENLYEKLLVEAQNQLRQSGYGAMTIRSVAAACGIGVGTVYNYFTSKDEMIAEILLRNWNRRMDALCAMSLSAPEPRDVALECHNTLLSFSREHEALFASAREAQGLPASFRRYHAMLREQLSAPLRRFCETDFAAEFVSEALLTWTMAGKPFEEIYSMVSMLLNKKGEMKSVQL